MKVIEFPEQKSDQEGVTEFMSEVSEKIKEAEATSVVVLMMDDDRNMGMAVFADPFEAIAMLSLALREA